MKVIIFLFLISTLNLFPAGNPTNPFPKDVKEGESFQRIVKNYPKYHFKFYKEIKDVKRDTKIGMSFAMLGYWNKGEGCVLLFTNDRLIDKMFFKKIKEYKKYINNPDEKQNIVVNEENLVL